MFMFKVHFRGIGAYRCTYLFGNFVQKLIGKLATNLYDEVECFLNILKYWLHIFDTM